MIENVSLLSNLNRVEVPIVKVVIGDYTFGVYNKSTHGAIGKTVEYVLW